MLTVGLWLTVEIITNVDSSVASTGARATPLDFQQFHFYRAAWNADAV